MTKPPTARQRLIEAVGPAIVQHGVDGLTVQHVLDAADVSRRTYYKHFRGLPDLLSVVYDLCCDQVQQQIIEAIEPAKGLRDKATTGVDRWVDLVTDPQW
ncbi:MAG: AcrR family transcriptional regulator, partial [Kiritimatiellia bacterium]